MQGRLARALAFGMIGISVPVLAQAADPVPGGVPTVLPGGVPPELSFRKLRLNPQFYSEGIHHGDFNHDGSDDIVSGPYFYPGPAFTEKIAFRAPRAQPFDTTGDSDCYSVFPFDFNGDGFMDILSLRQPGGAEAVWYENPAAKAGPSAYWTEHVGYSLVENESAALTDINGDGKPEMVTNSAGYGGWATPDWSNPQGLWAFRKATAKGTWGAFTHGLGIADVNGDGRRDLIFPTGWWEQPAKIVNDSPWVQHPAAFWAQAAPQEGPGGAQIYAYDVDGDGDNDVVTSLQAHGYGLAWFENKGQGLTFSEHRIMFTLDQKDQYGAVFSQLHALAIGDLDGDGLIDLVTGKRKGAHGHGLADVDSPAVLYWFRLTRPAGQLPRFEPYLIDSEAGIGTQLTVADVNGDGAPDILTARRSGAFVFFNQRKGTGLAPARRGLPRPGSMLIHAGRNALGRSLGPGNPILLLR